MGGAVGVAEALEALGEAEQGGEGEFVGAVAAQAPRVGAATVHRRVDEPQPLAVGEARVPAGRARRGRGPAGRRGGRPRP